MTTDEKITAIRASFQPQAPGYSEVYDCILQDDGDGNGPYIREWRSATPCPYPELVRAPLTQ